MKPRILALLLALLLLCGCAAPQKAPAEQPAPEQPAAAAAWDSLTFDRALPLSYAEQFTVSYAGEDYTRITIGEDQTFLLVAEGAPVPAGVPEDVTVLQQPLDHIYLVATAAMDFFRALDAVDRIALSGQKESDWYIDEAKAAMQAGTPVPKKPIVQPQEQPAAPPRNTAAHNDTVIIPTSRPRYTQTERRAMLEEVQRRQAEREAARQAEARAEEEHFRTYRDREYGKPSFTPAAPAPAAPAQQPAAEDARTLQMPAVQPAAPAPQAAPQPKVTAPQPVQTAPQPAAAPAPKHKRTAPANSYKEAEAALNERIRADHILLSNPVIVRGLGLAPVIGAALDGQRALMLCIAALILVTFTRMLAVAVCHLTGNRFRPVIYCYTAALLYIPTYVLLYALFGADLTLLGIYLPILVVEPAIVKRMEFSELEPVKEALRHGFNNALGMCVVLLLVGCLRELLATGAVFGHVVMHNALLPLAALPAGGFVILGVMAACWCAAANLYTVYKHEEVRRLYADRKH